MSLFVPEACVSLLSQVPEGSLLIDDFHNHTSEVRGKRNARYREKCFQKNKFGTDPYRTGSAEAGSAEHRVSDTAVV